MKKRVWLSFDLTVRGDYESFYAWLDSVEARECGDSVATFAYEIRGDVSLAILRELKKYVEFGKKDRVYLVYPGKDGAYYGKYIIGKRKAAPWAGYAVVEEEGDDESDES